MWPFKRKISEAEQIKLNQLVIRTEIRGFDFGALPWAREADKKIQDLIKELNEKIDAVHKKYIEDQEKRHQMVQEEIQRNTRHGEQVEGYLKAFNDLVAKLK